MSLHKLDELKLTNPVTRNIGGWHGLKTGCGWATQGDNGACPHVALAPGQSSPIMYVGHLMSSLNDGSWNVPQQLGQGNTSLPGAKFEVALSTDCRHHGTACGFVHIGTFGSEAGGISVVIDANMVATQRTRTSGVQLLDVVKALRGLNPELHQSRFPALMPIYGTSFGAYSHNSGSGAVGAVKGPVDWWGWRRTNPDWSLALDEWLAMMPLTSGTPTQTWGRIN